MNGKLTDNEGNIEHFAISNGAGLLSANIDELRIKINARLTDYCNTEKVARGESAAKKSKTDNNELE